MECRSAPKPGTRSMAWHVHNCPATVRPDTWSRGVSPDLGRSGRVGRARWTGDPGRDQESKAMVEHEEQKTLETLTAADVMTAAPLTCSTFSTVLEAVMIFRDADCGAVPILEEGRPVGILTDRDVALSLAEYPRCGRPPRRRDHEAGDRDRQPAGQPGPRLRGPPDPVGAPGPGGRSPPAGWSASSAGPTSRPSLSDRIMGRLVTETWSSHLDLG